MIFSQRDPKWASQRLGTADGYTLGGYGCYVTAMAMVATHFGKDINPAQLDDVFTEGNMYVQGGMAVDGMLSRVYPDIAYGGAYHCETVPCDLEQLNRAFKYSTEAIIEVDFNHNPADGVQTHFVRFNSWDGTTLLVDDPWYGDRVNFADRYGDPTTTIQKIVFYDGPALVAPVEVQTPVAPITETPALILPNIIRSGETVWTAPDAKTTINPSSQIEEAKNPTMSVKVTETLMDKLKSRKLWVTILGILAAAIPAMLGYLNSGQAVTTIGLLSAVYVAVQGQIDHAAVK